MYSREQASLIRKEFWTTFGNYMSPIRNADGEKTNWLNYKTGLKHVYFRLDADKKTASAGIEITHPDEGIQELFYEQFLELKAILHQYVQEDWQWELHTYDDNGKTISRIYTGIEGVNVFNKNDWHQLITFFKEKILALDEFWCDAKYSFDSLK